jgi:hypothetical protein
LTTSSWRVDSLHQGHRHERLDGRGVRERLCGKKLSQTLRWSDLDCITEGKSFGFARARQKTEMRFWPRAWRLMRSPVRARFLRLLGSSHYGK